MYKYMQTEEQTYRKSISDSLERIERDMKSGFEGIYKRQDKTNGSVSSLKVWRGYITGGLAILTVVVLPMGFWVLNRIIMMARPQTAAVIQSNQ